MKNINPRLEKQTRGLIEKKKLSATEL